ncbi:tape measure protein [Aquirufa ecclesiirivi]|uniref:tape measure protein n=1 Tax=Aquirufa ecclesiirivi TaxID=2715124 RepID=UPI003BB1F352
MNSSGPLDFDLFLRDNNFGAQINAIENRIIRMSKNVESESSKIDSSINRMTQLAAGYFTLDAFQDFGSKIIQVRGEFQQLGVAFNTMLGSKIKGDQLMAQAVDFAAKTPFTLSQVGQASKQLLAYGTEQKNVISDLRMLGDVAAGVGVPINDLVYLYGTLQTQGKAMAIDIRQFAGRGIPIYEELSKVLKVNKEDVSKLVSEGAVGFDVVQKAFQNMTAQGSMFGGMMERQSKTLTGLTSNLQDAVSQMFNTIGQDQEGFLASGIMATTELVKNYKDVEFALKLLIGTYGTYKAALALQAGAQALVNATTVTSIKTQVAKNGVTVESIAVTRAMTAQEIIATGATTALTAAQNALNTAIAMVPWVMAATALAGLVAVVYNYSTTLTTAEKIQEAFNSAREKATDGISSEVAKIESLKAQLKSETISREEKKNLIQQIIDLNPDLLKGINAENIATAEGTKILDSYLASRRKKNELDELTAQLDSSIQRKNKALSGDVDLSLMQRLQYSKPMMIGQTFSKYKASIIQGIINEENAFQKSLKEKITKITPKTKTITGEDGSGSQGAAIGSLKYWEELLTKTQEEFALLARGTKEFQQKLALTKLYAAKVEEIKKLIDPKDDKIAPFGSLAYWENVIKKAQEVISLTPESNMASIKRQQAIEMDAAQNVARIKKELEIKTFEEELSDKKTQYELYLKWVDELGKSQADIQFSKLLKSGNSYADYLKGQINALESKYGLTEQETKNLGALKIEYADATGKKSGIDALKDSMDKAKKEAASLADYLIALKKIQEEMSASPDNKKRLAITQEIIDTQEEIKGKLKDFLSEVANSEQARNTIHKKFADLRIGLDEQYSNKNQADYQLALNAINKAEQDELEATKSRYLEQSEEYKKLQDGLVDRTYKAKQARITLLTEFLNSSAAKSNPLSKQVKEVKKEIKELNDELDNEKLQNWSRIAQVFGQLGGAMSSFNGGLGEAGKLMAGLAQSTNSILVSFDKKATDTQKLAAGIEGLVSLVDIIASSANERRKQEEEYYRNSIQQQYELNIALNEQIGLQSQLNGNPFTKDVKGQMTDKTRQLADATKQYNEALAKLGNGSVKVGQDDSINWGNVGKGASAGAATGAAVGSIFPVIGNAVGAIVGGLIGGITGLFAGKTKQDQFANILKVYPGLIKTAANGQKEFNKDLAATLVKNNQVDESTKQLINSVLDWTKQIEDAQKQLRSFIGELAGSLGTSLRDSLVGAFKDGSDAAQAFGDSVSKVLEDIMSQMIFDEVFKGKFDELTKEMEASMNENGDGSWIDDFGRFFANADSLWKNFATGIEQAKSAASGYGVDIFKKNPKDLDSSNSLSGSIKGLSEETGSIIAGQMNAIRINQAESLMTVKAQLMQLSVIAVNTSYLKQIRDDISAINSGNSLRSKGITG